MTHHTDTLLPEHFPAPCPDDPGRLPVVLSWGLGIDSNAVIANWILDPSSRNFDLADLIVLVAMTGDEHPSTEQLATTYLLPLLRQHQVRLVQVARGGPSVSDGIVVLDDSRNPTRLVMRGPWTLSDELRTTGTVPQVATGRRICSIKMKGAVLDAWIARELGDQPFRHVMGFNADEQFRVDRDKSYSTEQRNSEYPLLEWGWGRQKCEDYLLETFGVPFLKSCCSFCPFAGNQTGLPKLLERWAHEPEGAVTSLLLEHTARALNPASKLFGTRAALDEVLAAGDDLAHIVAAYQSQLDAAPWSLYRIRRIIHARGGDPTKKGPAWRSVQPLETGARSEMDAALATAAAGSGITLDSDDLAPRVWVRRRGERYPTVEEFLVAAPAVVPAKERAGFATAWGRLVEDDQLQLFAGGA